MLRRLHKNKNRSNLDYYQAVPAESGHTAYVVGKLQPLFIIITKVGAGCLDRFVRAFTVAGAQREVNSQG